MFVSITDSFTIHLHHVQKCSLSQQHDGEITQIWMVGQCLNGEYISSTPNPQEATVLPPQPQKPADFRFNECFFMEHSDRRIENTLRDKTGISGWSHWPPERALQNDKMTGDWIKGRFVRELYLNSSLLMTLTPSSKRHIKAEIKLACCKQNIKRLNAQQIEVSGKQTAIQRLKHEKLVFC